MAECTSKYILWCIFLDGHPEGTQVPDQVAFIM
jgi:hypothetical protein